MRHRSSCPYALQFSIVLALLVILCVSHVQIQNFEGDKYSVDFRVLRAAISVRVRSWSYRLHRQCAV